MQDYALKFDLSAFAELDEFALLACQRYNLGNDTDWFGTFRGGLYGLYSRIHGIEVHYRLVHSWIPRPRLPVETEYHVASILFNMDSALECLVYALNALGFAAVPTAFRDITSRKGLARVSPRDILGAPGATPPKAPLEGYAKLFSGTQAAWLAHRDLIQTIFELHDVSKHREIICIGGMARLDPPNGFYEQLGVAGDRSKESSFWPYAEIVLRADPKAPLADLTPRERNECPTLEDLAEKFARFVSEGGRLALEDAKSKVELMHPRFRHFKESAS